MLEKIYHQSLSQNSQIKRGFYRDKQETKNVCSYNPRNAEIMSHMNCMGKAIDSLSSKYENFLLIRDFNAELSDMTKKDFCDIYGFKNLIKEPTCFKNPTNPKCIDLMLTNKHRSFQNSFVIETDLSGFHKMTVTVLRFFFKKKSNLK